MKCPFCRLSGKNASALIIVAARNTKADESPYLDYQFNCGLAVGQLVIETHHRGLVAHQMTGFDKSVAQSAVEVPVWPDLHIKRVTKP
jgi:hypothetical protein